MQLSNTPKERDCLRFWGKRAEIENGKQQTRENSDTLFIDRRARKRREPHPNDPKSKIRDRSGSSCESEGFEEILFGCDRRCRRFVPIRPLASGDFASADRRLPIFSRLRRISASDRTITDRRCKSRLSSHARAMLAETDRGERGGDPATSHDGAIIPIEAKGGGYDNQAFLALGRLGFFRPRRPIARSIDRRWHLAPKKNALSEDIAAVDKRCERFGAIGEGMAASRHPFEKRGSLSVFGSPRRHPWPARPKTMAAPNLSSAP